MSRPTTRTSPGDIPLSMRAKGPAFGQRGPGDHAAQGVEHAELRLAVNALGEFRLGDLLANYA
jgi:hypothetical protein